MARTYRDNARRRYFNSYWQQDRILVEGFGWRLAKTTKPKLRKTVDTEDHWMSTPGWWVRLTMNRPQRRAVHLWERKALFSDLEELVQPAKKVAHVYYW